ncbi:MAG: DNA polymerase IV, partial [Acidimicrobiia bacterium]
MTVANSPLAILHVDLDAFYASVEQLEHPALRGRPVIVGGLGPRGVVAAASYEARRFGVHSALPMGRARRLCPEGVFLAPRFDAYHDASRRVMAILCEVTPVVEPIALDEAFLDVTGARRGHGPAPMIAGSLRERIRSETGLTASVGVAGTKLLAKLASDLAKPDGLLVVDAGAELEFLHPLPVERLWGVGPATRGRLAGLGVKTVGQLAALPEATVVAAVGDAHGRHLHALAWNRDDRLVEPDQEVKSIGSEETFSHDLRDRRDLERHLARLAERTAERLRKAGRAGRTVQLKLRYADFRTITRSRTFAQPTDLAAEIGATARALLARVPVDRGIRLLGVSVQQLAPAEVQGELPLAGSTTERDNTSALERSVD